MTIMGQVCKKFLAGTCTYGPKCIHEHVQPPNMQPSAAMEQAAEPKSSKINTSIKAKYSKTWSMYSSDKFEISVKLVQSAHFDIQQLKVTVLSVLLVTRVQIC